MVIPVFETILNSQRKREKRFSNLIYHLRRLFDDDTGYIFSLDLMLLGTILVIGSLVGHTAVRDALNSELADLSNAVSALSMNGPSSFEDTTDFCDDPDDTSGAADNCITFDAEPQNETEPKEFVLTDVGEFDFDDVNTGAGGSATGTIGDAGHMTGFNLTTDTGNILGTSNDLIAFRESPESAGTFTTTFNEPLTNVEFFVTNLTNINNDDNLLGNFTVTLSDGTVLNNAAFSILPDVINPNTNYGEFRTGGSDRESLQIVTVGGLQYVTDPTQNGAGRQAAGRIVFDNVPGVGTSPGNPVGITSISFDRSGGPNNFRAFFGISGQVIICDH